MKLSELWARISLWPVVFGRPCGGGAPLEDGKHLLLDFRSSLPWKMRPAMFSGKPEPYQSNWIVVPNDIDQDPDYFIHDFIAVCSPLSTRKNPHERTLLLPLIRVRKGDRRDYTFPGDLQM